MKKLLLGVGLATTAAYFLRDRVLGMVKTRSQRAEADRLKEETKRNPDDATLAQKVESEIFRDVEVPKGQVNVNAEYGVVYLRGQVESEDLIRDLEERTRQVQGVNDVRNLLHTPGSEAPTSG